VSELKYKDAQIEEMWKVIEDFGINRAKFERTNPSDETIKSVYLTIKSQK
jgi:hypothetical protein